MSYSAFELTDIGRQSRKAYRLAVSEWACLEALNSSCKTMRLPKNQCLTRVDRCIFASKRTDTNSYTVRWIKYWLLQLTRFLRLCNAALIPARTFGQQLRHS